jgi:Spy/CpxP family protein refolding chaperone
MNWKILRNTLVVGLLLVCTSPAITRAQSGAQDSGQTEAAPAQNPPAGPNLNLTDDQQAQMKKTRQDAKSQIKAVENDASLSAEQKQEKIRQIHRAAHKQVEAILTPSQKEAMKEWRIAHKEGRPQ